LHLAGHISRFWDVTIPALGVFGTFWLIFWCTHNRGPYFFDPQDCVRENTENRKFPMSAETATFEPMLKHYIGVTQLLVTVAAASIAFGGSNQTAGGAIVVAKLLLAWSIFYGVLFWPFCYGVTMNTPRTSRATPSVGTQPCSRSVFHA
jgi:hypothetical protein